MSELRAAALAFDAVAPVFDGRFGEWQSVVAQRGAVRRAMELAFPPGGHLLELGGGTGEDAVWLAQRGFKVLLTDASPNMVRLSQAKLAPLGSRAEIAAAEEIEQFADRHLQAGSAQFDGAFSNFAPLNCVEDLRPTSRGLARLVKAGGSAVLVLFGIASPGEILVESLRGRPGQAFRRFRRAAVPARLGGQEFNVTYHRGRALALAMQPWFRVVKKLGIGIFVPPSAAEPWISRHPRLLNLLESLDTVAERPLALLGDHVLYQFERTTVPPT
jgi:ubiquinone/menaquinone biosynthesis C-methylase UbiE